ncbi:MAG TPA: beta-galactosidase [Clostridiales bacterium]|nr:beta-galactosidase [Clostridiales bacterium]
MNTYFDSIPRPEYPRPQMLREDWINLNGSWEFEMDFGRSGKERKLFTIDKLQDVILVPFCPESKLSGIEYTDFIPAVWYRRSFIIPDDWVDSRVLIHFGAVDYESEVWINGASAGTHKGGYSSFSFDITEYIQTGENIVTVYAEDDVRSGLQPRGKQRAEHHFIKAGCDYTRTTGIWQTVWLERVPKEYISSFKVIPDPDNQSVHIKSLLKGNTDNLTFRVQAAYDGRDVGQAQAIITGNRVSLTVNLEEKHLWEPGVPNLYDLELTLENGNKAIDRVTSYFGLRSVSLGKDVTNINGKPVFQRLVLDQGFYPDGIYTAPTDEDLRKDIGISLALGFNGARLHEKVFEPRFLYWADKMGYLVWGEHANWGLDIDTPMGLRQFLPEWMEVLERDFNHPSIVGWCPFNETWDKDGKKQDNEVLRIVYNVTKAIDTTRPVIDTSGNYHVVTDIFDIHDYDQDPESLAKKLEPMKTSEGAYVTFENRQKYEGQPYFVSEYGGIWWNPGDKKGWGYGTRPKSEEEFLARYKGLTELLLKHPRVCAFCYTQLYDIEQEVNGLYTYDRKPKFDPEIIKAINNQKAAIEE